MGSSRNDTNPYELVTYPTVHNPFGGAPDYSRPDVSNNPELVPEIKETKEAGLELRLFKDRLSANVSVYDILSRILLFLFLLMRLMVLLAKGLIVEKCPIKGLRSLYLQLQ